MQRATDKTDWDVLVLDPMPRAGRRGPPNRPSNCSTGCSATSA
jgi:hypothetical protein